MYLRWISIDLANSKRMICFSTFSWKTNIFERKGVSTCGRFFYEAKPAASKVCI